MCEQGYVNSIVCCVFFFSSRRRHTRCSRDWSSDVCSSDLTYGKPLLVLMGMVGLLLLIACLNLANLQGTRMLRRSHEFAMRSALGASRLRLLQQIVAEIIPLGACGGLLSLGLAHLLGSALVRVSSDRPTHLNLRFGLDGYVFCSVSLLIALILFQILPARKFLFAETLPAVGLTSARGSIGARGSDGGDAMLGAQVALCVLLLSLAAMFVRTLKNLNGLNAGLDWRNILTVRFDFYNSNFGDAALATLYPQMLDSLRSLPGVRFAVQDMRSEERRVGKEGRSRWSPYH